MGAAIFDRTAVTDHPVMEVLAGRWSPRAYDATAPLDEQKLSSALEAARWAPSANNVQPWRFIVARRGTAEHAAIVADPRRLQPAVGRGCRSPRRRDRRGRGCRRQRSAAPPPTTSARPSRTSRCRRTTTDSTSTRWRGFDRDALRARFGLEERFRPVTVITLGDLGDPALLPDGLRERESAPRSRRPLSASVLASA